MAGRGKKSYTQLAFPLFLIIGTAVILWQRRNAPYQHHSGTIFGTVYNVTYQSRHDLTAEITAVLNKVDSSLSMFNEQSVVSRINKGENITPDKMFLDVFKLSQNVSEKTGGAFDATVAPLVNAWGFGRKKGAMPTRQDIDSLLKIVGYKKVKCVVEGGKSRIVKQDERTTLDFGAIAKGYGADAVAAFLASQDVQNYMVEIGGEVVTHGDNSKQEAWKIGISKPTDDSLCVNKDLQTVLNVHNAAMATSGNYRNYYYSDGRKYAHTIDPKTGLPVQHSLLSATVVASRCAIADAYATAFMVLGIEKAKQVLDENSDIAAYLIYADEKNELRIWCSPTIKAMTNDE